MALAMVPPKRAVRRAQLARTERLGMICARASPEKLPVLARFVKYMAARGIVEFGPPLADGEEGLASVDRVQQRAFVALYYGLDTGFGFNKCRACGPAPSEPADAVYRPSGKGSGAYGAAEPVLPGSLRSNGFLELAYGKGRAWLDAATTMPDINMDCRDNLGETRDKAVRVTRRGPTAIDDALSELKKRGMLPVDGQPRALRRAAPDPSEIFHA